MINDSSVIIIYATLLGAGEMLSIMTSSLQYLSLCFLMIPFAYVSERFGKKRQILWAAALGCLMLLGTAAAPWCGRYTEVVLMGTLAIFAVTISAYVAAWFPLLDGIVPPEQRGLFFGRMRFAWQTVAALFIFISGWVIGEHASIGTLQIIIALAALGMLGRFWYVNDMVEADTGRTRVPWSAVWRDIVSNRQLTGFSVYLFCLYTLANATIPVVFIFAKKHLLLADNVIVISSACAMGGLLCGYLTGGWMVHRHGVKPVFLVAHLGFGMLNILLLTIHSN
jgi:MFS family permease